MEMRKRYKLNNKGATMMVAVVIIAILMVFTFSLLLVSYTLYASQSKKVASLRNSEAVNSLSRALETELTYYDLVDDANGTYDPELESALWKYLRCNIAQDTWPYYSPGVSGHQEEDAYREFDLKYGNRDVYLNDKESLDGFPASLKLRMYWVMPDEKEYDEVQANPTDVVLFVEILGETASQTYVIQNKYKLVAAPYGAGNEKSINAVKNLFGGGDAYKAYNPDGTHLLEASGDPLQWRWETVE